MEELLTVILYVVLFLIYLLFLPAILIVATPFILLWPGKKQTDGSRAPKQVGQRYLRILKFWKSFGEYIP
jgi:hypothetical protein